MNSNVGGLLNRGMELAREGRLEEANDLLRQVVAEDAGIFDAWLWLGAIAADPRDSVAYLEKALSINPNSLRAQKGLVWAKDKLAQLEPPLETGSAALAPSPAAAAPPDATPALVDEALPPSWGLGAAPSGVAGTQDPPTAPEPRDLGPGDVATNPPVDEAVPPELGFPNMDWQQGRAFADEGPAPFKLGDDASPPPPAVEPRYPSQIELPEAILSAFRFDEDFQPEENPPSVPPADDVSAEQSADNWRALDEPKIAPQPPDYTSQPDQYSPRSPLFGDLPEVFRMGDYGLPADNPPAPPPAPVDWGPKGADEASAPTESWDAIIARLRSLDDQFQKEPQEPAPGDDSAEAHSSVLESVPDDEAPSAPAPEQEEAPPASFPAALDDEEAVVDRYDDYAATSQVATPPAEPAQAEGEQSIDRLVEKGKLDLEAGRLAEAVHSLRQALAVDPNHVEANEQLGIAEYQAGNVAAAIATFERLVALRPQQAEGHANLGFLYAEKGAADAAIAAFREALRRDHELLEAHLGLADLYKGRGNIDDAIKEWSEAARLRPDLTDILINLGEAYAGRGQLADAIREYRLLVERKPDDARAHLRLGQLLTQTGSSVEAAREYMDALRIAPSLPEAHYGLASCLADEGKMAEAVAELERALATRPDYLEADEKLSRLRASIYAAQVEQRKEEVKGDQEKKSRWGFLRRDKN